ncbi:leucine-rich repeat-containing protein 20 [Lates japonicus]|uniref:Leucine-rich repeat protein SHOC-2 n=1 Tax=Lates japonicus TaxID=270547 RepID=A0AAD3R1H8_LATJO|nr:leucine-rich repeat-containing protein 20 [Lates japonicus]
MTMTVVKVGTVDQDSELPGCVTVAPSLGTVTAEEMAEAVANVARRINATVEEGKDTLDLSNCKLILSQTLRELDLQGNVLTKLPDAVGEMEHLTSINLANNSFSIFPDKLTEIATLERINLEGNSITEIPVEKLSAMPALKWLNVRSNPLDSNTQSVLQSPHKFDILSTTES